ncbi:MAG: tetratricopeptide repeat protein [Gammaproteobacteria bacterium]|nr:MAG: tetratricopeptide repeat protein [Gammaproteobacteria bacterium]
MTALRFAPLIAIAALLAACGSPYPIQQRPAPVEPAGGISRASPPSAQTPAEVEVRAYEPPARVATVRRPASPAVRRLIRTAVEKRRAGDYQAAQASLERALRIEPRNARLWNRLAHLYAEQGQYARVESLAAKSNALAPNDPILQADNWSLIAGAREAMGDRRGAAEARRRARLVQ